jgi:hypothetical protein
VVLELELAGLVLPLVELVPVPVLELVALELELVVAERALPRVLHRGRKLS